MSFEDKTAAFSGSASCTFHADDIAASEGFRQRYATLPNVVKAEDMPWERSADGLIKHLVHRRLNTRECCVEAYMQFLKAGERSGKHRHMWEEVIFVVAGVIVGCRLGVSEHIADNHRVFELRLDEEDRGRIAAVTRKGRDLFERIGDCGDEYRGN